MADRPIIFSAPMVRALLDGRKSQTRRLLPLAHPKFSHQNVLDPDMLVDKQYVWFWDGVHDCVGASWPLPYAPGDRLWVRENWSGEYYWHETPPRDRQSGCWGGEIHIKEDVWYWADGSPEYGDWEKPRPSIHMPRWASRLTLTVTDVRVQRLADLTDEDAISEGIDVTDELTPSVTYAILWDKLNAKRGFPWKSNPWIVALTFQTELNSATSDQ